MQPNNDERIENMPRAFYAIPAFLFDAPEYQNLTLSAIHLYSWLLDRSLYEAKENNWIDSEGKPYALCSIAEAQKFLRCGNQKAARTFKELDEAKLITRKRQGLGMPNIIYVRVPTDFEG